VIIIPEGLMSILEQKENSS